MYVSRRYLEEKYLKVKMDMENVLKIFDETLDDKVDERDVERTRYNIIDNCKSIINEFSK